MKAAKNKSAEVKKPVPSREDLRTKLRAQLPELHTRYGVRELWMSGSYASGTATSRSDLDLLVEFERTPSLFEFIRLERLISEQLGVPVDLVMNSALKPGLGKRILQERIPISR
jgi:uncharacterized protein